MWSDLAKALGSSGKIIGGLATGIEKAYKSIRRMTDDSSQRGLEKRLLDLLDAMSLTNNMKQRAHEGIRAYLDNKAHYRKEWPEVRAQLNAVINPLDDLIEAVRKEGKDIILASDMDTRSDLLTELAKQHDIYAAARNLPEPSSHRIAKPWLLPPITWKQSSGRCNRSRSKFRSIMRAA